MAPAIWTIITLILAVINFSLVSLASTSVDDRDRWIVDSGAANYVVNDMKWFKNGTFQPLTTTRTGIGSAPVPINGYGEVDLHVQASNRPNIIILRLLNAVYMPSCFANLLSLRTAATAFNASGTWNMHEITFAFADTVVEAKLSGQQYYRDVLDRPTPSADSIHDEVDSLAQNKIRWPFRQVL